jgi:hypothetical protein
MEDNGAGRSNGNLLVNLARSASEVALAPQGRIRRQATWRISRC